MYVFIGFRFGECEMLFPSCIHEWNLCCERTFYGCIERQQQCKMHNSRELPIWIFFIWPTAEWRWWWWWNKYGIYGRHKHHCAFSMATMQCRRLNVHRKKNSYLLNASSWYFMTTRADTYSAHKRTARHSRHITTWRFQKFPVNLIVFCSWFCYSMPLPI